MAGLCHPPLIHSTKKEQSKQEFTEWVDIALPHFRAEILELITNIDLVSRGDTDHEGEFARRGLSASGVLSALGVPLLCTLPVCFKNTKDCITSVKPQICNTPAAHRLGIEDYQNVHTPAVFH